MFFMCYEKGQGQEGSNRVIRGGSWKSHAQQVRAAYRNGNTPGNRNNNLGFRLAREQEPSGSSTPDPIIVLTGLMDRQKHLWGWRASRAVESAPSVRRSTIFFFPPLYFRAH